MTPSKAERGRALEAELREAKRVLARAIAQDCWPAEFIEVLHERWLRAKGRIVIHRWLS